MKIEVTSKQAGISPSLHVEFSCQRHHTSPTFKKAQPSNAFADILEGFIQTCISSVEIARLIEIHRDICWYSFSFKAFSIDSTQLLQRCMDDVNIRICAQLSRLLIRLYEAPFTSVGLATYASSFRELLDHQSGDFSI